MESLAFLAAPAAETLIDMEGCGGAGGEVTALKTKWVEGRGLTKGDQVLDSMVQGRPASNTEQWSPTWIVNLINKIICAYVPLKVGIIT